MLVSITEIPDDQLAQVFNLMVLEAKLRYPGDSQRKIAESVGIPPAVFSRCKAGTERPTNIRTQLRKFAVKLMVSVDLAEGEFCLTTTRRVIAPQPMGGEIYDPTLYFIYHYVANSPRKEMKIGKALLAVNLNRRSTSLFFYASRKEKELYSAVQEMASPTPIIEYYGEVTYHQETTYLLFNNRKEAGGEAQDVPALVCLDVSRGHLGAKSILLGSFATAGPAAGMAVLQRSKGPDHLDEIFNKEVVPEIGKILVGKRYARKHYQEDLFDYWTAEAFVQRVQSIEGIYQGFYLEERFPTGKPEGQEDYDTAQEIIKIARFEIYDGHKIKFRIPRSGDIKGYITKITTEFIHARFDYDYQADHFAVAITLNREFPKLKKGIHPSTLGGAYLSSRKRKIVVDAQLSRRETEWKTVISSGRIMLAKVNTKNLPSAINLADDKAIDKLLNLHPYILEFFGGRLGDFFTDSPMVHKSNTIRDVVIGGPVEEIDRGLRRFQGLYITFRLATDRRRVYQRPVNIFSETADIVRRIEYVDKTEHKTLFGKASIIRGEVLSLDFNTIVDIHPSYPDQVVSTTSRHTLIHTDKGRIDGGRAYQGVTVRLSRKYNPISFREYYVKVEETTDYQSLIKNWTREDLPEDNYYKKLVMELIDEGNRAAILQH